MIAAVPKYLATLNEELEDDCCIKGERLETSELLEALRKYHLHLNYLRQLMSLDDPDVNWKVDEVLDHLVKEHEG
jgi:hypothetical protein